MRPTTPLRQQQFAENLIKGRIAETIFELMFREATIFDMYPLGYEHTIPILRQLRDRQAERAREPLNRVAENLTHTPDLLLCLPDKTQVYLVEVKYRREATPREILRIAQTIHARWHPVLLFVATREGFYYDSCEAIVRRHGNIPLLPENLIPRETQANFLTLLRRFEH